MGRSTDGGVYFILAYFRPRKRSKVTSGTAKLRYSGIMVYGGTLARGAYFSLPPASLRSAGGLSSRGLLRLDVYSGNWIIWWSSCRINFRFRILGAIFFPTAGFTPLRSAQPAALVVDLLSTSTPKISLFVINFLFIDGYRCKKVRRHQEDPAHKKCQLNIGPFNCTLAY